MDVVVTNMTNVVVAGRGGCLVTCLLVAVAESHQGSGVVKNVKDLGR